MENNVLKVLDQPIVSFKVYNKKDKEGKPTDEKNVIVNYVGRKKSSETGYYEDVIIPFFISLTDLLNYFGLKSGEEKELNVKLKGKRLVVETKIL